MAGVYEFRTPLVHDDKAEVYRGHFEPQPTTFRRARQAFARWQRQGARRVLKVYREQPGNAFPVTVVWR